METGTEEKNHGEGTMVGGGGGRETMMAAGEGGRTMMVIYDSE